MTDAEREAPGARLGFVGIAGLANLGSVIAYLPLLSILLPLKVEQIAGDARFDVFTACVLAGGICASIAHIVFGWLSDISRSKGGGRRPWMVAGLFAMAAAFALFLMAQSALTIVIATAVFQVAVNVLLAPLGALLAEEVPDAHKGLLGGLLSLGYPVAAIISQQVMAQKSLGEIGYLAVVLGTVIFCMLPVMLVHRPAAAPPAPPERDRQQGADLWVAWGARILIQAAGAMLSLYLIYYFESLGDAPENLPSRIAGLLAMAYLIPVPIAILIGRWSDRIDRRKPFLFAAAIVAALGLVGMIVAHDWHSGVIAFCVYATGSSIFLSLHASFSMQLLFDPDHRGRDLGLINLANTLPILIGPGLTWMLATPHDFDPALAVLAVLSLAGGGVILLVKGRR